jgi:cyclohexanone monooxygenase
MTATGSPARPGDAGIDTEALAIGGPDCTPGYYNNEGQDAGQGAWLGRGYPYGPNAYFAYIDRWRTSGTFGGLDFR